VSPRTIFDQTSATVYLDIRVLQCQDEAVYTVRITSDLGQIQRQTELQVLRESDYFCYSYFYFVYDLYLLSI
jgi:hypothetical protein